MISAHFSPAWIFPITYAFSPACSIASTALSAATNDAQVSIDEGWVLPKGTVEDGEEYDQTALREVREETGARAQIIQYIGKSQYSFNIPQNTVEKVVHWYLMRGESYYSKPQREEYFVDSGFYKYHEAYHLLKFSNEKMILEKGYEDYLELKRQNRWG